ncbi:RNA polymerase sporulation-specific sigma factor [Natranaerovirga hydrolytica]|uniref:RNA polymerase sigma factor n=1 Tax=Natranaerovirga hydrolytica TaxID=680378 RepID=A0A4R1N0J1_9FIRM|nr:RNA polymerase sporulation-specific sigma factor [Natranaerovirga hydrolytica]
MLELILGLIGCIVPTFYISGNQSFPQPLSSEEEHYYLKKYEEGDLEAKNILIERNLRLVAHIVKKYNNTNRDIDDLISIGTIGLIKAVDSFNLDKGTRLATYAARCIENELLMMLRIEKKQTKEVSLQEPIGIDKEGNVISLMDVLENDSTYTIIDEVDLKIKVKELYEKMKRVLKDREKLVIELRYGLANQDEMTQREIANMLGISRSYVSRIEKKALKKLYKAFEER